MNWLLARLDEASTWNSIAVFFTGIGGYLALHDLSIAGIWICAIGAGASALAGFIKKEKNS